MARTAMALIFVQVFWLSIGLAMDGLMAAWLAVLVCATTMAGINWIDPNRLRGVS